MRSPFKTHSLLKFFVNNEKNPRKSRFFRLASSLSRYIVGGFRNFAFGEYSHAQPLVSELADLRVANANRILHAPKKRNIKFLSDISPDHRGREKYARNFAAGEYLHALRMTVGAFFERPRANAVRPYKRSANANRILPLWRQSAILFVRSTTKKKSTADAVLFFLRCVDKKDANTNMLKIIYRQRFFQQVPQFYR